MKKKFFNEWYPEGPRQAEGAVSMTKVKNLLKREGYEAAGFRNTRVNGQLRGCYGFVRKAGSGKVVFVDTEYLTSGTGAGNILVRFARDEKDYCGHRNEWTHFAGLAYTLARMFDDATPDPYDR